MRVILAAKCHPLRSLHVRRRYRFMFYRSSSLLSVTNMATVIQVRVGLGPIIGALVSGTDKKVAVCDSASCG